MNILLSKHELAALRRLDIRQLLTQLVVATYSMSHMYVFWKYLGLFLNNDSPIVCVLSASMEPGFKRGDILLIKPHDYSCGDIVVYQVYAGSIPIVHRIIHKKPNGRLLTKGDNNQVSDEGFYRRGHVDLEPKETRAGVFGFVPLIGMPSIWISSVPGLRLGLLLAAGVSVFLSRQ